MCSCLRTAANRLTDSHCGLAGLLRRRSEDAEPAVGERNPSSSERPAGESADSGAVDDGACDATAGLELLQKARDAGGWQLSGGSAMERLGEVVMLVKLGK